LVWSGAQVAADLGGASDQGPTFNGGYGVVSPGWSPLGPADERGGDGSTASSACDGPADRAADGRYIAALAGAAGTCGHVAALPAAGLRVGRDLFLSAVHQDDVKAGRAVSELGTRSASALLEQYETRFGQHPLFPGGQAVAGLSYR